ncbi:hypothetical protein RKD28_001741 [Streptomyces sp. SAI-229]|jgi:hypothetical protein
MNAMCWMFPALFQVEWLPGVPTPRARSHGHSSPRTRRRSPASPRGR